MAIPNQVDPQTTRLAEWYDALITSFRERSGSFTAEQINKISNTDDYREPFQAEILWFKEPEFQVALHSRDRDLPDRLVTVEGPFPFAEHLNRFDEVLGEGRWNKYIPFQTQSMVRDQPPTFLRESLTSALYNLAAGFRSGQTYAVNQPARVNGQWFGTNYWLWLWKGNAADSDLKSLVDSIEKQIQMLVEASSRGENASPSKIQIPEPVRFVTGTFYPPVYIGRAPRPRGIREMIMGGYGPALPELATERTIGNQRLLVYRNGWLHLSPPRRDSAVRTFNTIFAIARLEGVECLPIKDSELGESNFNQETKSFTNWSYPGGTPRFREAFEKLTAPRPPFSENPWTEVSDAKLAEILASLDRVRLDSDLVEDLGMWLEAAGYAESSEYAPAFVLSWIVIERSLSRIWKQRLRSSGLDEEREAKLLNPGSWDLDHVLESLNLLGLLDAQDYEDLMNLKGVRNKFVHRGKRIPVDAAKSSLTLAEKVVRESYARARSIG